MSDGHETGLRFIWEWDAAPTVRTPELAATWSRLTIVVDDVIATLVEQRDVSRDVRKSLDVPTYPLAEWLALNWWKLNTTAHRPGDEGLNFSGAGDGFPWPNLALRPEIDRVWVEVRRRDADPDFVRFLNAGRAVLDAQDVTAEVGRFIDSTVRRLEDNGITGTLLQDEWSAIQSATADEVEFCRLSAAWGLDPYNVPPNQAVALIGAAETLGDSTLLTQLATAVEIAELTAAEPWLVDAVRRIQLGARLPVERLAVLEVPHYSQPWLAGYSLATSLRQSIPTSGLLSRTLSTSAMLRAVRPARSWDWRRPG